MKRTRGWLIRGGTFVVLLGGLCATACRRTNEAAPIAEDPTAVHASAPVDVPTSPGAEPRLSAPVVEEDRAAKAQRDAGPDIHTVAAANGGDTAADGAGSGGDAAAAPDGGDRLGLTRSERFAKLKAALGKPRARGPAVSLLALDPNPASGSCGCAYGTPSATLVGTTANGKLWVHYGGRQRQLKEVPFGESPMPQAGQLYDGDGLTLLIEQLESKDRCEGVENCEVEASDERVRIWLVDEQLHAPLTLAGECGC